MNRIEQLVDRMEPAAALAAMKPALMKTLTHLDEETRIRFVAGMLGKEQSDKLSSMVHL
jgi:hypothetical protein